jgi:hypothetical protein
MSDSCLNELRSAYAAVVSPDLTGTITTGHAPPVYRLGENMSIVLGSNGNAYYLLLDTDAAGNINKLAPVGDDPVQLIAGVDIALPRDGTERFLVGPPAGQGTLTLILSDVPAEQLFSKGERGRVRFAIKDFPYLINP